MFQTAVFFIISKNCDKKKQFREKSPHVFQFKLLTRYSCQTYKKVHFTVPSQIAWTNKIANKKCSQSSNAIQLFRCLNKMKISTNCHISFIIIAKAHK